MTTSAAPRVDCERHQTTLYVSDFLAAVDFYTNKLGFSLGFSSGDPPVMADVNLDQVQIFLEQRNVLPPCSMTWRRTSA